MNYIAEMSKMRNETDGCVLLCRFVVPSKRLTKMQSCIGYPYHEVNYLFIFMGTSKYADEVGW